MPADAPLKSTRRAVDEAALRRAVTRLQRAPQAPWLHGEAARRMADRLPIVKIAPRRVLDWWSHLGGSAEVLKAAYPRAEIVSVEPIPRPQPAAAPWWSPRRWSGEREPVMPADVPPGEAQLVWANMMLHVVADPLISLRLWQRALAVDGFLMFSTLGPGTLVELRDIYSAEPDWGPPMAPLVDMHDLGDMLVEAGFADPVMDQESLRLTWRSAREALVELRSLGSNVEPGRMPGLRTPRWRQQLEDRLERVATRHPAGRVEFTFELVYGHAFKPQPRARVAAESAVDLADMRAMLRGSRQRGA
jgi:malonyl-CoA O-methyltransferase